MDPLTLQSSVASCSLAFTSNTWTAIGSVGTAIAVLVALVSFLFELHGRQRTEVAKIRERVQTTAVRTRQFVRVLEDGHPLLDAAWHSAQSVRAQAGPDPTAAEMRNLVGVPVVATTAAVEGWANSPWTQQLQEALGFLDPADDLTGDLSMFSASAELLREIVRDGYSVGLFLRLLVDYPAEKFRSEHRDEGDVNSLTRALTEHLQGNGSLYFQVRYQSALQAIVLFVDAAATGIVNLKPRDLIRVSRAKSAAAVEVGLTQQMRGGVTGLRGVLSGAAVGSLEQLVDQIESGIGKESAEELLRSEERED